MIPQFLLMKMLLFQVCEVNVVIVLWIHIYKYFIKDNSVCKESDWKVFLHYKSIFHLYVIIITIVCHFKAVCPTSNVITVKRVNNNGLSNSPWDQIIIQLHLFRYFNNSVYNNSKYSLLTIINYRKISLYSCIPQTHTQRYIKHTFVT